MLHTAFFLFIAAILWLPQRSVAGPVDVIYLEELEQMLASQDDTTYIINFWATWCAPCVKELPYFEEVERNGRDHKRKVILVSLDFVEQLDRKVIPFVRDKELVSTVVLLDAPNYNDWIPKVHGEWSGAIPVTVIVNGAKDIYEFIGRSVEEGELEDILEKLEL